MNSGTPYLIAAVVLALQLALMVSIYLWVQRHRQPDAARIKVLTGLLWFLFLVLVAMAVALVATRGPGITSPVKVLLPVSAILLLGAGIIFQIRQCQRRLRQEFVSRTARRFTHPA